MAAVTRLSFTHIVSNPSFLLPLSISTLIIYSQQLEIVQISVCDILCKHLMLYRRFVVSPPWHSEQLGHGIPAFTFHMG